MMAARSVQTPRLVLQKPSPGWLSISSFTLLMTIENVGFVRHAFRGKVRGDIIVGTASVSLPPHEKTLELPWRARLQAESDYFAPTGTAGIQ